MNKNGSAIIWVVSTLLIFMIIVGGIMVMVGSSHKSALHNNYKQQAYFTALSAVRIVSVAINSADGAIVPDVGSRRELSLDLSDKDMGYADVSVLRESPDEIIIMGLGNYLDVKDSINLRLNYIKEEQEDENEENGRWEVLRYERGQ